MVAAPQIVNLFLHLAIQTRHPDKKWLSSFKASIEDIETLQWDHHGRGTWETQSHRLWCFFGTAPGDKWNWATCFEIEFKGTGKSRLGQSKLQKQVIGTGEDKNDYLILSCAGLLSGGCRWHVVTFIWKRSFLPVRLVQKPVWLWTRPSSPAICCSCLCKSRCSAAANSRSAVSW